MPTGKPKNQNASTELHQSLLKFNDEKASLLRELQQSKIHLSRTIEFLRLLAIDSGCAGEDGKADLIKTFCSTIPSMGQMILANPAQFTVADGKGASPITSPGERLEKMRNSVDESKKFFDDHFKTDEGKEVTSAMEEAEKKEWELMRKFVDNPFMFD